MLLAKRVCCFILSAVFLSTSSFANTSKGANIVSTIEMVESFDRVDANYDMKQFTNNNEVKEILRGYGITEEEISIRLASLTDIELAQLQSNLQKSQAGGLLELILLVILILYFAKRI